MNASPSTRPLLLGSGVAPSSLPCSPLPLWSTWRRLRTHSTATSSVNVHLVRGLADSLPRARGGWEAERRGEGGPPAEVVHARLGLGVLVLKSIRGEGREDGGLGASFTLMASNAPSYGADVEGVCGVTCSELGPLVIMLIGAGVFKGWSLVGSP